MIEQNPLFPCCNCYEDYSYTPNDLRVYRADLWCEACWDISDQKCDSAIEWGDLDQFVPEHERRIKELEPRLAAARKSRDDYKAQRDALAAKVARIDDPATLFIEESQTVIEFLEAAGDAPNICELRDVIAKAADDLAEVLNESPAHSMAEIQAQAIENIDAAKFMCSRHLSSLEWNSDHFKQAFRELANKIRNPTQEQQP